MLGLRLVLPLFIIIAAGNLLRARGFYSAEDIRTLMKTLFWIILPLILFRATYGAGADVLKQSNLFFSSCICFVLSIAAAWAMAALVHKGRRLRIAVSVLACYRSNSFYLGFPVATMALGEAGLTAASVYMAVIMIPFQFLALASTEIALCGKLTVGSLKATAAKLVKNPLIISCVAGMGAAMIGIRVPGVVDEALKLMTQAATSVALIALGGSLDLSSPRKVIGMLRRTWSDNIIKTIVCPAILYALLHIMPIPETLFKVSVLLIAMPTAVDTFIVARGMKLDGDYAADLVAATTITAIIAIPVWVHILHLA